MLFDSLSAEKNKQIKFEFGKINHFALLTLKKYNYQSNGNQFKSKFQSLQQDSFQKDPENKSSLPALVGFHLCMDNLCKNVRACTSIFSSFADLKSKAKQLIRDDRKKNHIREDTGREKRQVKVHNSRTVNSRYPKNLQKRNCASHLLSFQVSIYPKGYLPLVPKFLALESIPFPLHTNSSPQIAESTDFPATLNNTSSFVNYF